MENDPEKVKEKLIRNANLAKAREVQALKRKQDKWAAGIGDIQKETVPPAKIHEPPKPKKVVDTMKVLDPHPKELSSPMKALIGLGTLMLILAPIIIFLALLYQIKDYLGANLPKLLDATIIIGAIIGIGNVLFDIFSRLGIMRAVYTWIGINVAKNKNLEKLEGEKK